MAHRGEQERGWAGGPVLTLQYCRQGTYLTDGRALLRVESLIELPGEEPLIELENSRTLDIVVWPARDLFARGLRRVATGEGRALQHGPRPTASPQPRWPRRRGL